MKKFIPEIKVAVVMSILMIAVLAIIWLLNRERENETYPQTMVVVGIENDTVIIEDFNGFQFQFDGAEDWMVGDICSCIMRTNGTETIVDDEIVDTRYSGYIREGE